MQRLKNIVIAGAYFAFVGFADVAQADDFSCAKSLSAAEGAKIISQVEKRFGEIQDLGADFEQTVQAKALDQLEASLGTVQFKKPGRMNWSYAAPEKQQFVTDGSTLWFYQPESKQVTLGEFRDAFSSDLPVSFLIGIGKLSQQFSLRSACRTKAGIKLDLKPQSADQALQDFVLLVRSEDSTAIGAKVTDLAGNETMIRLQKIKVNQNLGNESFVFEIPRGVYVSDQRQASASSGRELHEHNTLGNN